MHNALLSGNPHDQLAIAYHLIVDNKLIEGETAKLDLKDLQIASSPPPFFDNSSSSSSTLTNKNSGRQRVLNHSNSTSLDRQRSLSGSNEKNKTTPMKKAKWHLGIRSQSKPQDIMNEVYRAMKLLDFVSKLTQSQFDIFSIITNLGMENCESISCACSSAKSSNQEICKDGVTIVSS